MKKLIASFFLTIAMIALSTGCSSGVERIGLTVHLTKLERKPDGSTVATLLFRNPNIGSVNIARSTHELALDGQSFGTLKVTAPVGMPALQTSTVTTTVQEKSGRTLPSGSASYQLKSTLVMSVIDDDTENYKTSSSGRVTVE